VDQITTGPAFRDRLLDRRQAVEIQISRAGQQPELERLLREVDEALVRLDNGSYGICESCHEPIEAERIAGDPLVRFCLDHLTASEQRALERDLELAARMQRGLLPPAHALVHGWEIAYHYEAAGVVSGDYCDYVATEGGDVYFMMGDVSGKGVAASMLMAHLHATLRTLILMRLPLDEVMERASSLFSESALPAQYATLVCGRASPQGEIEISNAGHPPPLVIRSAGVDRVDATGLPVGMFRSERFDVARLSLQPGEGFLLYTDGVVETLGGAGDEYGRNRLAAVVSASETLTAEGLVGACIDDLTVFRASARMADDVTVMAMRRRI
jgi:sigma-B regulation protein RsbU (phosphoserine phosphatase)